MGHRALGSFGGRRRSADAQLFRRAAGVQARAVEAGGGPLLPGPEPRNGLGRLARDVPASLTARRVGEQRPIDVAGLGGGTLKPRARSGGRRRPRQLPLERGCLLYTSRCV